MKYFMLYIILTMIFISCTEMKNSYINDKKENIIVVSDKDQNNSGEEHTIDSKLDLDSLSIVKIEIQSYEKKEGRNHKFYNDYEKRCQEWNLSKSEISEIILNSKRITSEAFHYLFDVLPCSYYGKLSINDTLMASFEINSGSYVVIDLLESEQLLLGYFGKENYFIVPPWKEGEN